MSLKTEFWNFKFGLFLLLLKVIGVLGKEDLFNLIFHWW